MPEPDVGAISKKIFDVLLEELGMSRTPFDGNVAITMASDNKVNAMLNVMTVVVGVLIANIIHREGIPKGMDVLARFTTALMERTHDAEEGIKNMGAPSL